MLKTLELSLHESTYTFLSPRTLPHHFSLCQDIDDWIDTTRVRINNVGTTDGRKGKNTRARLAPAAPAKCAQGRRRG